MERFGRKSSERGVASLLPASGARTGWDPAWPGLAGTPGFGELSLCRSFSGQNAPSFLHGGFDSAHFDPLGSPIAMPHRIFTVEQVAEYLHLASKDVERLMRESDMPHAVRGGHVLFRRGEIDAWASQRILGLTPRRLDAYHEMSMRGTLEVFPGRALIPDLLKPDYIDLELRSKTRASAIRDMIVLANLTGRVFDARELLASVEAREALCSTALPGGFALLHARQLEAYRFEGSFIVLGRTIQDIPYGATDGRPTRLFFLVCCQDERIHLHTLARLCLIAQKTEVIAQLSEAPNADSAYGLIVAAEQAALQSRQPVQPAT